MSPVTPACHDCYKQQLLHHFIQQSATINCWKPFPPGFNPSFSSLSSHHFILVKCRSSLLKFGTYDVINDVKNRLPQHSNVNCQPSTVNRHPSQVNSPLSRLGLGSGLGSGLELGLKLGLKLAEVTSLTPRIQPTLQLSSPNGHRLKTNG